MPSILNNFFFFIQTKMSHNKSLLFVLLFLISTFISISNCSVHTDDNTILQLDNFLKNNRIDDDACLVCQFGLAIIEENIGQNVDFWESFLVQLCDRLPTPAERSACRIAVNTFGVEVIIQLLEKYNPDYVCGPDGINVCQQCTIDYVDPKSKYEQQALFNRALLLSNLIKNELIDVPESVLPEIDLDGDYFSPVDDLRRTAKWRGKDW